MKYKYNETHNCWNKVARLYQERFMELQLYNDSYDHFCQFINTRNQNAASILEVGCGPGNITKYISDQFPNFKMLGIDVAPAMIELAKENVLAAEFQVLDGRDITQLKRKFDAAICGFIIPYLDWEDCSTLIADISDSLEETGLLYLSFVDGKYQNSGYISGSSGDRIYFYYHSEEFVREELERSGFEILKVLKLNYEKSDGVEEEHSVVMAGKVA